MAAFERDSATQKISMWPHTLFECQFLKTANTDESLMNRPGIAVVKFCRGPEQGPRLALQYERVAYQDKTSEMTVFCNAIGRDEAMDANRTVFQQRTLWMENRSVWRFVLG